MNEYAAQIRTAVAGGWIHPEFHEGLLRQLPRWAREAGIEPDDVLRPMTGTCEDVERKWLKLRSEALHTGACYGLVYVGPFVTARQDVAFRMRTLAGCLLRYYVDARVVRARACADLEDFPEVLFVPDSGTEEPAVRREVGALIVDRAMRRIATVLHLPHLEVNDEPFGETATGIVRERYMTVETR